MTTPTNFFLGQAFSGPLRSPHAYTTCLPDAWLAFVCLQACRRLPIYTTDSPVACGVRVCKLLPCFPCAFLYTTASLVACGLRVCKLLPCSPFRTLSIRHMLAPRVPALPQASLCLPTSLALPTCYFAALLARNNRVCPTLSASCDLCLRKVSRALPQHVMLLIMSFSCLSHELLPSVSAQSLMRAAPTSLVLLFPSLPCAPYTTFPHALTRSPLLSVGRGPAPGPGKR